MIDPALREKLEAIANEAKAAPDRQSQLLAATLFSVIGATRTPFGLEDLNPVIVDFAHSQLAKMEGF